MDSRIRPSDLEDESAHGTVRTSKFVIVEPSMIDCFSRLKNSSSATGRRTWRKENSAGGYLVCCLITEYHLDYSKVLFRGHQLCKGFVCIHCANNLFNGKTTGKCKP